MYACKSEEIQYLWMIHDAVFVHASKCKYLIIHCALGMSTFSFTYFAYWHCHKFCPIIHIVVYARYYVILPQLSLVHLLDCSDENTKSDALLLGEGVHVAIMPSEGESRMCPPPSQSTEALFCEVGKRLKRSEFQHH